MLKHAIDLRPSRGFISLLIAGLFAGVFMTIISSIFLALKAVVLVLLSYYLYIQYITHGILTHPSSLLRIEKLNKNEWLISDHAHHYQAELSGQSVVTAWVMILLFKVSGIRGKKVALVWRDAIGKEHYRRFIATLY